MHSNKNKDMKIPFGAKDSEQNEFTYVIPAGYEALIEDGKVIVRKQESEDERIRKELLHAFGEYALDFEWHGIKVGKITAWLEKKKEEEPSIADIVNGHFWEMLGDEKQDERKHIIEDETLDGILLTMLLADNTKETYGETIERYKPKILSLLNQQKPVEWTEEDIKNLKECKIAVRMSEGHTLDEKEQLEEFLESFLPKKQQDWNKEDERLAKTTISFLEEFKEKGYENAVECIDWIKSRMRQLNS